MFIPIFLFLRVLDMIIHKYWNTFYSYYIYTLQSITQILFSFTFSGLFLCFMSLTTGVTVHPNNAWQTFSVCRSLFPNHWYNLLLSEHEFLSNFTQFDSGVARNHNFRPSTTLLFGCDTKEIKYGPILTTLPCSISTGEEAFRFFNLTLSSKIDQSYTHFYLGFLMMFTFALVFLIFTTCFIHCNYLPVVKSRYKETYN